MKKSFFSLTAIILMSLCVIASAHSGRTDSSGGHYDRSTGEYHYHHGMSAHDHPNGICPYEIKDEAMAENEADEKKPHNTKNIVLILVGILFCATSSATAYYLGARHGIPRLKRYKRNLAEAVDNLKSTTIEKDINIDCDGIFKYKATARRENSPTEYDVIAEVMVYTTINRSYGLSQTPKKTEKEIAYYLHRFHWKRGGHISFISEVETDKYAAPKLVLNRETKATSTEGEVFYIKLTSEIIKELPPGKKEIEEFRKSVYRNIDRLLNDTTCQHKYFAELISDYRKHLNLRVADELKRKSHPAIKSSEKVHELANELKETEKKYKNLKYKLNMYGIKDVEDITLEDAKHLQAAQEYLANNRESKDNKE